MTHILSAVWSTDSSWGELDSRPHGGVKILHHKLERAIDDKDYTLTKQKFAYDIQFTEQAV